MALVNSRNPWGGVFRPNVWDVGRATLGCSHGLILNTVANLFVPAINQDCLNSCLSLACSRPHVIKSFRVHYVKSPKQSNEK